jgi:hypothetical protein
MNAIIQKTIGIGDAGLPFDVTINVEYEEQHNVFFVTDWMEDECPYDNPSEKWYARMQDIILDFFYDRNQNFKVVFK